MTTTNPVLLLLKRTIDSDGELGNTYLIDPKAETVTPAPDVELTEHWATVIIDGDEDPDKVEWPEDLAFHHQCADDDEEWIDLLEPLAATGEPFYVQTVQIDYVTGEGDDTEVEDGVGWGVAAMYAADAAKI